MKNLQDYSSITYRRFLSIEEGNVILNRDIIFYWLDSIKQEKLYSYTKMYMDIFMKNKSRKYLQEYTLFLYYKSANNKFTKQDISKITPVDYYILTNYISYRILGDFPIGEFRKDAIYIYISKNVKKKNMLFFD